MFKSFLIIALLLIFAEPCTALQITFRPTGQVDGTNVTLGDIVTFDEKSELTTALATQKVAQSPTPGDTVILRSINIKRYLVATLSLSPDIDWIGASTVALTRSGISIGSDKIQNIIADFIRKNKSDLPDAEIRFIPGELPIPFVLPQGDLSYEVIPSNPHILGSSRFSIIFRIDNRVAKNMSVKGHIEALAPVVVATTRLKKGLLLRPNNLTLVVKDLSDLKDPGLDVNNYIGKKLRRTLRAGSPLSPAMVETLPIIMRGERVKMILNHGTMHLSAVGIARNDGRQGQMIKVQNIASNKIVYCRVAAPGIVEVLL